LPSSKKMPRRAMGFHFSSTARADTSAATRMGRWRRRRREPGAATFRAGGHRASGGACGYLLKTTAPARLVAIGDFAEGGAVMSPEIAMRVVDLFSTDATAGIGVGASCPARVATAEPADRGPPPRPNLESACTGCDFICDRCTKSCMCIHGRKRWRVRCGRGSCGENG